MMGAGCGSGWRPNAAASPFAFSLSKNLLLGVEASTDSAPTVKGLYTEWKLEGHHDTLSVEANLAEKNLYTERFENLPMQFST